MKDEVVRIVEKILARGERVELIPVKDGVKVVRIRRETISSS